METIGIIGTGTWGTALAQVLSDNGYSILMYGHDKKQVQEINSIHKNIKYFGENIILSKDITAVDSLKEFANKTRVVVLSVPTAAMREVLEELKKYLNRETLFINTAKGFDPKTDERMSVLIRSIIPNKLRGEIVSLIGPSHAEEVILKHLTAICSVSKSLKRAEEVQLLFSNNYFRVYTLQDEIGAEIGVAMKNSIAIASGMLDGLGYGDNAKAALVTRGLVEIISFGKYFGGKEKTYIGLTGIGDLMVTCNSKHSRNYRAGYQIGLDDSSTNFLANNSETVEGIRTTKVIHDIAKKNGIDVPIVNAIYQVLYKSVPPSKMASELMLRPLKSED